MSWTSLYGLIELCFDFEDSRFVLLLTDDEGMEESQENHQ